jgi:diaminopimelate epimerase
MRFTKMHGIGNDYVYVDCLAESVADPAGVARRISDRHFGVGGDGLILILPSQQADVRMRIFNADGSEAEMCGNGIRCLAKYVHDRGLAEANPLRVETAAGIKTIEMKLDEAGKVTAATVDMGEPILTAAEIPAELEGLERGGPAVSVVFAGQVNWADQTIGDAWIGRCGWDGRITCVSMGNPHAVLYCDDVSQVPLEWVGPVFEVHPAFPERINVHFVEVRSRSEVTMRTWERGSGITLACGTGASAVCVAGVLTARGGREVLIHLPGGDLKLEWRQADKHVYMTGPATEVFSGDWPE